jgi:hypothetical protein
MSQAQHPTQLPAQMTYDAIQHITKASPAGMKAIGWIGKELSDRIIEPVLNSEPPPDSGLRVTWIERAGVLLALATAAETLALENVSVEEATVRALAEVFRVKPIGKDTYPEVKAKHQAIIMFAVDQAAKKAAEKGMDVPSTVKGVMMYLSGVLTFTAQGVMEDKPGADRCE